MNQTIIRAVLELESKLLNGLINEQSYQRELDILYEMADNKTKEFILAHKDREI